MQTLVVNQREVRELLPMTECIEVVAAALQTLSKGEVVQPLRTACRLPDRRGLIGLMPAYLRDIDAPGVKVVTVYPGNHGTELDSHQGAVLLFEGVHGSLVAVMDGSEITAIRTAAASGVATRLLAREDATELAIIGSGVQARTHLEAMVAVRPIARARVWSRNADSARAFADKAARRTGIAVEVATSARAACDGADIVCTTTSSSQPVLEGAWLASGTHINAVGACVKAARELDTAAVVRSRLYVDCRESTLNEAGDFLIPREEGAIGDDHIVGELGEVLLGRVPGRRDADEVTLFKSLGVGVEDVAAAHHIYHKARERGLGMAIELGGARDVD